jgi:hypothetical protein
VDRKLGQKVDSWFREAFPECATIQNAEEDPNCSSIGNSARRATIEKNRTIVPVVNSDSRSPFQRSFLNKCADKIGDDQPTAAIQMNAVCMEEPAVHSGDFIRALPEHQRAECIAIEGEKAEFRKSASR